MPSRLFDHIDLRVSNMAAGKQFYDAWLPALGFTNIRVHEKEITYFAGEDPKNSPFIGMNEEPGHRGNANRIAFWLDTEDEVKRVGELAVQAGAQVVEGPEYCHEYTPGYFAVFFEDADGNKWEICCRTARVR